MEKWPIDTSTSPRLKKKAPAGEPRPQSRPQKNPMIEPTAVSIVPPIKIEDVKEQQKVAMSITETSSKIHKPKIYDEAVNNPIHGRRWQKAIEDKLQNLENHQT